MSWTHKGPLIFIVAVAVVMTSVAGCGMPRDISTPRKALLGHWKNIVPGSTTELYYNEKYVVFSGKRKEYQLVYDVLGESNPDSSLVIKLIGANADVALTDKLVFSSDRNTIEVYRTGLSYKLKFSYLDERREPDGYVARQPTAITAQDRAVP